MAQWLGHWIFDQEVLGSNPVGVESFSAMPYFSSLRLSCRKILKMCMKKFDAQKIFFDKILKGMRGKPTEQLFPRQVVIQLPKLN